MIRKDFFKFTSESIINMHYNYFIMNNKTRTRYNPQKLSGITLNLLEVYVLWQNNSKHIPKMLRYSIGVKIDSIFSEIIETVYIATFSEPEKRIILIDKANTKNDLVKFMINVLFELKGLKENFFIEISEKLEEIGRRLYGWKNQLIRQNQNKTTKNTEFSEKDKK